MGNKISKLFIFAATTFAAAMVMAGTAFAETYTVDDFSDAINGACNPGTCTLRDALTAASAGGADTVTFSGSGTITLLTPLTISQDDTTIQAPDGTHGVEITSVDTEGTPPITVSGERVTLDGLVLNAYGTDNGGQPMLNLTGGYTTLKNNYIDVTADLSAHAGGGYAIRITSVENNIGTGNPGEGNNIGGAIVVDSGGMYMAGNFVGTSSIGTDIGPGGDGSTKMISINGSDLMAITIGGSDADHRNVLGNWGDAAIWITNTNPGSEIYIHGNYIGVAADGVTPAPNSVGISVTEGFAGRLDVGSSTPGDRNVIAGNTNNGIMISTTEAADIIIEGNYIGTDSTGNTKVETEETVNGIHVDIGAEGSVRIGPTRNVIAGGISVFPRDESSVQIYGNYLGIGADGETVLGTTAGNLIEVYEGAGTVDIGAAGEANRNIISGGNWGIMANSPVTIKNNYIGLNASGTTAKGNTNVGIYVTAPADIEDNVISGNGSSAIMIGDGADGTTIYNNKIGTNFAGTSAIPNATENDASPAISVSDGDNILIEDIANGGNLISGNLGSGIGIYSGSAVIKANTITRNVSGINLTQTASAVIGSNVEGEGNTIFENYQEGIYVASSGGVTIKGNTITGTINSQVFDYMKGNGIIVFDHGGGLPVHTENVLIGGENEGDGNFIYSNEGNGIYVKHEVTGDPSTPGLGITDLSILGNYIGTNADGDDLRNGSSEDGEECIGDGICVTDGAEVITGLRIGSEAAPNIIKYNAEDGIYVEDVTVGTGGHLNVIDHNIIQNNEWNGIENLGSSVYITDNTITNNINGGIGNEVDYGEDESILQYADFIACNPTITGNTITDNLDAGDWSHSTGYQLIFFDCAATNKDTLLADNAFPGDEAMKIVQFWRVGVVVYDEIGDPITSGVSVEVPGVVSGVNEGDVVMSYTPWTNEDGGAWGPSGFDTSDISTFGIVAEYIVGGAENTVTDYQPSTITATVGSDTYSMEYSFDGESHDGTDRLDVVTRYHVPEGVEDDGYDAEEVSNTMTDVWILEEDGSTTVYALFSDSLLGQLPESGLEEVFSIDGREGTAATAVLQDEQIEYDGTTYTDQVIVMTFAEPVESGDMLVVADGVSDPVEVVYYAGPVVAEVCTSFTYSSWSACSGGTQTRTVLTSSPEGCEGGSPVLSQSCRLIGGGAIILINDDEEEDEIEEDKIDDTEIVEDVEGTEDITKQIIDTVDQVTVDKTVEKVATVEIVTKDDRDLPAEQKTIEAIETKTQELLGLTSVTETLGESNRQILDLVEDLFLGSSDADGDGVSNAQELKNGTNPLLNNKGTIENVFEQAPIEGGGNSSVGRLKIAAVSSNGFVLTGTAKPNTEVTVNAGGNTFKVTSDANGHYLVPVELSNVAVNSLISVDTNVDGKTSKILAKVEKDTIPAPTFSLEGKNVSQVKDFKAVDLVDYLSNLKPEWVKSAIVSVLNLLAGTEYGDTIIAKLEIQTGNGETVIVKGTATPGSTVILAYKSVIYSSVVIADKNGDFEAQLPKDLSAELTKNKDLKEIQHELISFAVDYKTNKVSPFTKGLFKLFR